MNRLNGWIPKFLIVAVLTFSLTALVTVLEAPGIGNYFKNQANDLVTSAKAAEHSDPNQAAVDYQMAALLQPNNHGIITSLADMYMRLDQPDDAIATLQQLPFDEAGDRIADIQFKSGQFDAAHDTLTTLLNEHVTANRLIAMSRTLLELNRGGEAAKAAKDAVAYSLSNQAAYEQLGLCQLVNNDESEYQTTLAALGSTQAAQTLETAHAYKLALARELYTQGLLKTSERVLDSLDTTATERYILLAQIKLSSVKPSVSDLNDAHDQLVRATKLDPANIDAHKLLEEVLLKQGDESDADAQAKLIKSLQTGLVN
jgi:thioredoxin-like negative regulator of GroEL